MHAEFLVLLIIWAIVLAIFSGYYWRRREYSAGVVLTYVILFLGSHALQGAVYAMPWYTPLFEPSLVDAGFVQSTIGLISLAVGAMIVAPILRQANRKAQSSFADTAPMPENEDYHQSRLPIFYLLAGLIAYFILTPLFSTVPTLSAFVSGLYRLIHIGLVLGFWQALTRQKRNKLTLFVLIGLVLLWPMVTILNDGFLGFGLWPTVFVFAFVALRQRRPLLPLILLPVVFYLGLSLIVTYYGERTIIRGAVWGGTELEARIGTLIGVFTNDAQFFDINNGQQLTYVDERLSLNRLIGLGVRRLDTGINDYAGGETILDAALMVIPRAIWPEKPIVAGGQELVNRYTGVYMYGSTSVALGQVLEFYVNFGTMGVIAGFLILGLLLALIDRKVANSLRIGNYYAAALWLIPAFGLWLPEDNLITMVGSSVSGWLTLLAFNLFPHILFSPRWRDRLGASPRQPVVESRNNGQASGNSMHLS